MVLFLCILTGVAALLSGLLSRIAIRFRIELTGVQLRASAKLCFFFGMIRIPIETETSLPLLLYRKKKEKKRKRKGKKPKQKTAFRELLWHGWKTKALHLVKFTCRGLVGGEDAFLSVMTAGCIKSVLSLLLRMVSPACKSEVAFRPSFMQSAFWIYMEGILEIVPTEIISVLIKVRKRGGKENASH